jgi:acetyl-CoA carboxylase biotin carboxyl carrier protein
MNLSEEDVQKILRVIDELEYGEIRLEVGELKLHVQKNRRGEAVLAGAPAPMPAPIAASKGGQPLPRGAPEKPARGAAPSASTTLHVVVAPVAGVFYRAPGPGDDPFVQPGQNVSAGDTVCLLEVMKLFHSVPAGAAGRIAEIFVENGEVVSVGQALVSIEIAR